MVTDLFNPAIPACRAGIGLFRASMLLALGAGLLLILTEGRAGAHPGKLDEFGGHFDEKTTIYHYHRPKAEMASRKKEYVSWMEAGKKGIMRGKVAKIERPDAFWIFIPYRPAYHDFAKFLPRASKDDKNQLIKVWFLNVSPEASANRGKKYNEWFRKKVNYELGRKLKGKEVSIQFRVIPHGKRIYGMVFLGEENINLWLVLNGWSYYLLPIDKKDPNEKKFIEAEELARKQKAGLWMKKG